jgi:hypothetical protein
MMIYTLWFFNAAMGNLSSSAPLGALARIWQDGIPGDGVKTNRTVDGGSVCCVYIYIYGYESIPINTIFRGMNIHLPAILMFTRGIGF